MKKVVYISIALVAVIVAFLLGIIIGRSSAGGSKNNVAGVYQTDTWNGKTGTLALYEDGTCQYPSGGNATWKSDGNIVTITIENGSPAPDGSIGGITLYINSELPQEKIDEILSIIPSFSNVAGVSWDENNSICEIELSTGETDGRTSDEISKLDGVTIITLSPAEEPSISEHEATVMENGLMLHGHFFEKVSD